MEAPMDGTISGVIVGEVTPVLVNLDDFAETLVPPLSGGKRVLRMLPGLMKASPPDSGHLIQCPVCHSKMGRFHQMRLHLVSHFSVELELDFQDWGRSCFICNIKYDASEQLHAHLGYFHGLVNKYLKLNRLPTVHMACSFVSNKTFCEICEENIVGSPIHHLSGHYFNALAREYSVNEVDVDCCFVCDGAYSAEASKELHYGAEHLEVVKYLRSISDVAVGELDAVPIILGEHYQIVTGIPKQVLVPCSLCGVNCQKNYLRTELYYHYVQEHFRSLADDFFYQSACKFCGKMCDTLIRFFQHLIRTHFSTFKDKILHNLTSGLVTCPADQPAPVASEATNEVGVVQSEEGTAYIAFEQPATAASASTSQATSATAVTEAGAVSYITETSEDSGAELNGGKQPHGSKEEESLDLPVECVISDPNSKENLGKAFMCQRCAEIFPNTKKHQLHICPYKGAKTISPEIKAVINKKPRSRVFRCKDCGESFQQQRQYMQHIQEFHKEKLSCNQCDLVFNTKRWLTHHVKTVHNGERSIGIDEGTDDTIDDNDISEHEVERPREIVVAKKSRLDIPQDSIGSTAVSSIVAHQQQPWEASSSSASSTSSLSSTAVSAAATSSAVSVGQVISVAGGATVKVEGASSWPPAKGGAATSSTTYSIAASASAASTSTSAAVQTVATGDGNSGSLVKVEKPVGSTTFICDIDMECICQFSSRTDLLAHYLANHFQAEMMRDYGSQLGGDAPQCHLCHIPFTDPDSDRRASAFLQHLGVDHELVLQYLSSQNPPIKRLVDGGQNGSSSRSSSSSSGGGNTEADNSTLNGNGGVAAGSGSASAVVAAEAAPNNSLAEDEDATSQEDEEETVEAILPL